MMRRRNDERTTVLAVTAALERLGISSMSMKSVAGLPTLVGSDGIRTIVLSFDQVAWTKGDRGAIVTESGVQMVEVSRDA
jgi:hypothetical protein